MSIATISSTQLCVHLLHSDNTLSFHVCLDLVAHFLTLHPATNAQLQQCSLELLVMLKIGNKYSTNADGVKKILN